MSTIITNKARIYNARAFINSLGTVAPQAINSIYMFMGRTLPWTINDGPMVSDIFPPFPSDTVANHINVWNNLFHLKKINQSDCSLVIKRYDWVENTIYTQYDQNIDLFDPTLGNTPFYVLTTDLNVYKCLFNFNNGPSFIKPTGTSANIIQTGDGYLWKYMFTVNANGIEKFLTNEWIPVQTLLVSDGSKQWDVQQNAINGSIDIINILNDGFGYVTSPNVIITGDGSNASANAEIFNGQVSKIIITNRGQNYTNATVTVSGGQVTSIVLTNGGGSGYISTPSVVISGDGHGATAHAIMFGGSVTSVVIDLPGTGYTFATVSISSSPGITATANVIVSGGVVLQAVISPPGGHGSDPVSELGGFFAMLNGQFNFDENGKFTISNDFRTIGLVLNPDLNGTKTPGTASLYTMAFSLSLESVTSSFQPDDLISGSVSLATGVVLDYNATTQVLRVVNTQGIFVPGDVIATAGNTHQGILQTVTDTAQGSGAFQITLSASDTAADNAYKNSTIKILTGPGAGETRIITSNVNSTKVASISEDWIIPPTSASTYSIANIYYPDLQKDTGYILYIENRKPLERANLQIESISTVIDF